MPHWTKPACAALLLAFACSAPPPASSACLTRSDCVAGEDCVSGRCTGRTDGGTGGDAAQVVDAEGIDAFVDDAWALDAGAPDDAAVPVDAGPRQGESCLDPIPISLEDGRAHLTGTLADYRADYDTFCGENDAYDVIFSLELGDGLHDVDIVTGPASLDTLVAISDGCDSFYDCDDDRTATDKGARVVLHRFPRTRVFIMVKGYDRMDVGTFTLDVSVADAAPGGTTCATAIDVTGGAKVITWPATTTSELTTTCGGPALIDAYRLAPETDGTLGAVFGWFGAVPRSVAVVAACADPTYERWCEAATFVDPAYTVHGDGIALATGVQFVTVSGTADSMTSVYALDVSP